MGKYADVDHIGVALGRALHSEGVTNAAFANQLGTSGATVGRIISGLQQAGPELEGQILDYLDVHGADRADLELRNHRFYAEKKTERARAARERLQANQPPGEAQ